MLLQTDNDMQQEHLAAAGFITEVLCITYVVTVPFKKSVNLSDWKHFWTKLNR